jgi:hypothetical protein
VKSEDRVHEWVRGKGKKAHPSELYINTGLIDYTRMYSYIFIRRGVWGAALRLLI